MRHCRVLRGRWKSWVERRPTGGSGRSLRYRSAAEWASWIVCVLEMIAIMGGIRDGVSSSSLRRVSRYLSFSGAAFSLLQRTFVQYLIILLRKGGMAFDAVRDAILLNSPERAEYRDPFGEEEDGGDDVVVDGSSHAAEADAAGRGGGAGLEGGDGFKAPAGGGNGSSSHGKDSNGVNSSSSSLSRSPERERPSSSSSSALFNDVAQTPGGEGATGTASLNGGHSSHYTFPPTPGGNGTGSYDPSSALSAVTPAAGGMAAARPASSSGSSLVPHRQSSIFSLLSPEPPAAIDDGLQEVPQSSYFDGPSGSLRAEPEEAEEQQPAAPTSRGNGKATRAPTSASASASALSRPPSTASPVAGPSTGRDRLKPSLVVETQRQSSSSPSAARPAPAPAPTEPVKRGIPYMPGRRINGPAPRTLLIPLTQAEREFYLDPSNCRNPLRRGVQVSSRTALPPNGAHDVKGKGRQDALGPPPEGPPMLPDDLEIAPRYREPSPLDPAFEVDLVYMRKTPDGPRPGLARSGSGSSAKKRKRTSVSEVQTSTEYVAVAAHYNKRQNISREDRVNSPIIGLKSFNNWVKSVLIARYARDWHNNANGAEQQRLQDSRGGRRGGPPRVMLKVLDLGCGKGGDLQKWQKAGLREYIGVDIADVSVQQARSRWESLRPPRFDAAFYALDGFSNPLDVIVPKQLLMERPFDVVTMQFCMHYAFQSISKARMMLENVSRYLRRGGTFVGTIPDSRNLLARLQDIPDDAPSLTFGNEVYRITFDDRSKFPQFGHRYTFYLQDAVEDVPEYVVQWDAFEVLALEYGLKAVYHASFHELFEENRENDEFAALLQRMRVVNAEGESELTEEQWEAANIYVAFAFEKVT